MSKCRLFYEHGYLQLTRKNKVYAYHIHSTASIKTGPPGGRLDICAVEYTSSRKRDTTSLSPIMSMTDRSLLSNRSQYVRLKNIQLQCYWMPYHGYYICPWLSARGSVCMNTSYRTANSITESRFRHCAVSAMIRQRPLAETVIVVEQYGFSGSRDPLRLPTRNSIRYKKFNDINKSRV